MIAVVVALAVIGGGAFFLLSGDESSGPSDDGTVYTIALPDSSGDFTRAPDQEGMDMPTAEEQAEIGLQNMEGESGMYANFDTNAEMPEPGGTVAIVGGMWGEVPDPEAGVDGLFGLAAEEARAGDSEMELVGEPSDFSDGDAYVKCQTARGTEPDPTFGYVIEAPVCVWADYSTMGVTLFQQMPEFPADFDPNAEEMPEMSAPEPMSMDEAATITKQFRADSVVEAG
ncbi:hypothetical protein [Streptomyces sp. SBT349]|uniref:hypothetical protein n=1 Tax=Streptomyces sp. SBT349 TaxID=1580539 RepID=UPI00066BD245|nr:hypothetical protein [Streptomyces sp. SBT349]